MQNGCRKSTIQCMYHVTCSFYLWVCGLRTNMRFLDTDYSYWLGPDCVENMKPIR